MPHLNLSEEDRAFFSDYVERSFRNQADRDYIAARAAYRLTLYPQFLWLGLQAVEKYLKAILLFNCRETKSYGHNAFKVLKAVRRLPRLRFSIPERAEKHIEFLTDYGNNRYLDSVVFLEGEEWYELDWTVWHLRRYCRDFLLMPGDAARYESLHSAARLQHTRDAPNHPPTKFRIEGGLLEKILDGGPAQARAALVYKNPCYSRRRRKKLKNVPYTVMFENPTHVMKPQILPIVEALVSLPKDVLLLLRKHAQQSRRDA